MADHEGVEREQEMNDLLPLLLVWAAAKSSCLTSPFSWPSIFDPPPPAPKPPTPPKKLDPIVVTATPKKPKPKPQSPLPGFLDFAPPTTDAARRVMQTEKKVREDQARLNALRATQPETIDLPVKDIQRVLIKSGSKIKHDGLYGPATENAWRTIASQRKQLATIMRVGPKVARVSRPTFTALSIP